MKLNKLLITFLVVTSCASAPAMANRHCGTIEEVEAIIVEQYEETKLISMLQSENALYEIWINEDTSTWTALLKRPDGSSCIIASGSSFAFPTKKEKPNL